MKLSCGAFSSVGRIRSTNRNYYYLNGITKGEDSTQSKDGSLCQNATSLFVLTDGIGNASHGKEAASIAVKELTKYSSDQLCKMLNTALKEADQAVFDYACENQEPAGAAFALLLISKKSFACVNAGDVRIYHGKDAGMTQVSKDHVVINRRLKNGNGRRLSRYLGIADGKDGISPEFVFDNVVRNGEYFLLLTDGITRVLSNDEIKSCVDEKAGPDEICENLVRKAEAAGSLDNLTAMMIRVDNTVSLDEDDEAHYIFQNPLIVSERVGADSEAALALYGIYKTRLESGRRRLFQKQKKYKYVKAKKQTAQKSAGGKYNKWKADSKKKQESRKRKKLAACFLLLLLLGGSAFAGKKWWDNREKKLALAGGESQAETTAYEASTDIQTETQTEALASESTATQEAVTAAETVTQEGWESVEAESTEAVTEAANESAKEPITETQESEAATEATTEAVTEAATEAATEKATTEALTETEESTAAFVIPILEETTEALTEESSAEASGETEDAGSEGTTEAATEASSEAVTEEATTAESSKAAESTAKETTSVKETTAAKKTPGKNEAVVKNVVGKRLSEAGKILNNQGFHYQYRKRYGSGYKSGYVYKQSPKAGTILKKGSTVIIYVEH